MSVPDNPLFEEFLSGVEIVREGPAVSCVPYSRPRQGGIVPGKFPALYLRYPETNLQLDSVIGVICRELEASGCAAE